MRHILAIDPGTTHSAAVLYDTVQMRPVAWLYTENDELRQRLRDAEPRPLLAIEMMSFQGRDRPAGSDQFWTCVWIGRFDEAYDKGRRSMFVYRREVTRHLGVHNDKEVRRALIDLHGGDEFAIGGKRCQKCHGKGWFGAGRPLCTRCNGERWQKPPGPLHGLHGDDLWAAVAVAVTAENLLTAERKPGLRAHEGRSALPAS